MRAVALAALGLFASATARADALGDAFAGAALVTVTRVADLPPDVARVLEVKGVFWMADPGEDWNPGCMRDSQQPEADRRLVVAGTSPALVAVHYEAGGFARHTASLRDHFPDDFADGRCQKPS